MPDSIIPRPDLNDLREATRAEALALGFSLAGFTSAEPLEPAVQRRWTRWLAAGRAGEMAYLLRETPRRTHPRDLMPEAQCVVVCAAAYHDGDHGEPNAEGAGKVARYAWGEDYHHALRARLDALGRAIERAAPEHGWREPVLWRAAVDSAPLDERSLAERAGLGFIGKNGLLIHPRLGSWMLLGELLVSVPFPVDEGGEGDGGDDGRTEGGAPPEPLASCGACRLCLEACPTAAFAGPYELDPRRCISYLTIEQKGPIPAELADRMEDWAFGCDVCQEVCPFNASPPARLLPELAAERGAGPWIDPARIEATPTGKGFLRRWGATPLARPGLKGMRRNLAALAEARRRRRPVP